MTKATTGSTRLMLGGGVTALAMALLQPGTAQAQNAFQGTPTVVVPGSAIVQQNFLPGEDRITVLTPEAIINWRIANPGPGNINFLPQNRTGRFIGFNNFVVLNRILPVSSLPGLPDVPISRLIELNGTIRSEFDLTNLNQGTQQGGSVWFYSAGGILVGGSAVINVGSLVLTSNAIDTTGGLFGPGGEIRFVGTDTSGPVTLAPGATVTARDFFNPGGSYVAMVAPRVVQAGTINADGSSALIAAQAADVSINAGLFDIRIGIGTDDPNGVVHTGTTGGPLDTTPANQSRVYMVAVPRNTAIEMLLSGTVGFQTAGVSVADGAIVISAGRDIVTGRITNQSNVFGVAANMRVGDLVSLNGIDAFADGDIAINSATTACNGCRILDVNGSASFTATNAVRMTVGRGQEVQVTGDLTLRADNIGTGGTVSLIADRSGPGATNAALNGGQVNVFGNLRVDAVGNGIGGNPLDGAGIGGTATLTADGGDIFAGTIEVDASGRGDRTDSGQGADGTGGAATMTAANGGAIRARAADVRADGIGGGIFTNAAGIEQASQNGGNGFGGTALARAETGGEISLLGFSGQPSPLTVSANGLGSVGAVNDGNGTGGLRAAVEIADPASTISASTVSVTANGIGGVNLARNLLVQGITGGDGTGGLAELIVRGALVTGAVTVDASGIGSSVAPNPQFSFAPDPTAGDGTGGTANVVIDGVLLNFTELGITAEGYGGNARGANSLGGTGQGGNASLTLNGAAELRVADRTYVYTYGGGGAGEGLSGDGTGGSSLVSLSSATSVLRTGFLQVYGHGGGGGDGVGGGPLLGLPTTDGGDGFGGRAEISSFGLVDVSGAIELDASGTGGQAVPVSGDPRAPQGGNGSGGLTQLSTGTLFGAPSGRIQAGTTLVMSAAGIASNGVNASGDAQGGIVSLSAIGGGAITSGGDMTLIATAESTTGNARAGSIGASASGGRIATTGAGVLSASVNAFGANTSGGTVRLFVGNNVTPGSIEFAGFAALASGNNAGRIVLIDDATGSGFAFGSLVARANGSVVPVGGVGDLSGIFVQSADGAMSVSGDVTLETGGNIDIVATGTGGLFADGNMRLRAGRSITAQHNGANTPTLRAANIDMAALDSIFFNTDSTVAAGGNVRMQAGSTLFADAVLAIGGAVDLIGTTINVSDAQAATALTLTATGDATLQNGQSGGTTRVNAANIQVGNAQATGAGADIVLTTAGNSAIGTLNAARDVIITTGTMFEPASAITAARAVSLASTGFMAFGSVTSGSGVTITSGNAINGGTVTTTGAGANIAISAADFLRLTNVRSALGAVTMTARTALIDSIFAATAVDVTTTADATVTGTQSGGAVAIRSSGGGVSAQTVNAAGAVTLAGTGTVTSANVTSTGSSINVTGLDVGVGAANAATTLTLVGGSNVSLTNGTSGGTMTITGTGVVVQNARTTGATADIVLNSTTLGTALGVATAGRDIRINAADFIQLFGAQNAGRDVTLTGSRLIADGQAVTAARAITVSTTGNADFGSLTAGNNVTVASGGRVRGDGATSTGAGSAVNITAATGVTIGTVTSGGSAELRSSGAGVAVTSATTATTLLLSGAGDVSLGNGISGGTASLTGANIVVGQLMANGAASDVNINATQTATLGTVTAGRDISVTGATLAGASSTLTASRALTAAATGNAVFGTALAGAGMTMTSGGVLTGNAARTSGGAITLSGAGGLTMGSIQSAGTTSLSAANGAIAVADLQSAGTISATGRSAAITTRGGASFANLTATAGDARVTAATGDLNVTNGSATGTLVLTTQAGNLTSGQLTGGTIALTSSGSATLNGATTATGALSVDAVGNAAVNAVATGATVTVRSGNIAIGTSGRLGTAGTTTAVTMTNSDTSSRTFIGGTDVTTGYSLSATEMLRLFGGNITINAPRAATQGGGTLGANRPPDVVIGAFTLQGGAGATGNLGANGTLTIDTAGSVRMIGGVALEGMTATNRFLLNATEAIEVIAGQGSVRMSNGGALSGIIDLRSDDIAVATSAAITAIAGLTDINAIDDRLGQNDGLALQEGMLAANAIRMTARGGVYIQNTGTGTRLADRRGFTTGAGGLSITTAGPATRIVINGRIPNAAGTLATGRDTIPLINIVATGPIVTAGQFDQGSTANGCLIANPASCTEGDSIPPVQDIIDDSIGIGDGLGETPFALLIQLRDLDPLPGEPLIDDPVTGTGNDDLWATPCEPAEGEERCE